MLARWVIATLLCSAHGIGVSAPKLDESKIPWQDCPWLLQDRLDLRKLNPPLWCFNIKDLGQAECERAYLSPETPGGSTYRRCIYVNGACSQEKEPVMCRSQAATAQGQITSVESSPRGSYRSPPPMPPPPPPSLVRPSAVSAALTSRPSPSPPPGALDPFSPSMRLQPPRLMSADCRSITLAWTAPPAALASGVPPRFALYYGTGDASSEKPWNMGLRGTSTTVTGLRPAVSYSFYVAMSQTRGWGPRSAPLVAMTAANCPGPSSEVECTGPSLDAPLVSPLNCMAMAVELPPISTADGCSMTGREVVVQMRLPGEPWGDVQRDVQSGSVIIGDLDPLQAVEFRIALRRPGQPDWVGQETQRMVTEDGDSMADAAPKVQALWSSLRGSFFGVSWSQSRGRCRGQARYELQASTGEDALLDPSQQTWVTVADNVEEGGFEAACSQLDCCAPGAGGCAFRVRPLDVRGWARPGAASPSNSPASSSSSGGGGLLAGLVWFVLLFPFGFCAGAVAAIGRVVWRQYQASKARGLSTVHIDPDELRTELMGEAQQALSALRKARDNLRESATFLSRAWFDAVGDSISLGRYGRPQEQDADEEDTDMNVDDFAPMPTNVRASKSSGERTGFVEGAGTRSAVEDVSDAPRTVMRL